MIVYFREALSKPLTTENIELDQISFQFNDVQFAEADIYAVFEKIMIDTQHLEMFRPSFTEKQKQNN